MNSIQTFYVYVLHITYVATNSYLIVAQLYISSILLCRVYFMYVLSQSGSVKDDPQEGPNKFMLLCDSVHSSLALMNTALEEVPL